jgi:hypothetical protein
MDESPAPAPLLSPPVIVGLTGCAIVATAAWLGADWLRFDMIGVPIGLWFVFAAMAYSWRRSLDADFRKLTVRERKARAGRAEVPAWLEKPLSRVVGPALAWIFDVTMRIARALGISADWLSKIESRLGAWHDGLPWFQRPLRVGLDVDRQQKNSLKELAGLSHIEWVDVPSGLDDAGDCRRLLLDAIVRQPPTGPSRISTSFTSDREPAWYDWAAPRPLTYASVFPARVDAERITLADVDLARGQDVIWAARALEAAAFLSRSPARVGLAARLNGRRPIALDDRRIEEAMTSLAESLAPVEQPAPILARAIARVVSAHFCSDATGAEMSTRLRLVECARRILTNEPEATLRLAAARFGALEDERALDLLVAADLMLRRDIAGADFDHLAFVQSEVEHGAASPLTLGRVAAGICLVAANSPQDRFEHVREDILDDLRFSGWLIGRDHDRAVLIDVFAKLKKARTTPLSIAA